MTIDRQGVRMKVVLRTTDTVCNRSELLSQCFLPGFLITGKFEARTKPNAMTEYYESDATVF